MSSEGKSEILTLFFHLNFFFVSSLSIKMNEWNTAFVFLMQVYIGLMITYLNQSPMMEEKMKKMLYDIFYRKIYHKVSRQIKVPKETVVSSKDISENSRFTNKHQGLIKDN